jgi:signal transduction histidine kinase
MQHQEDSPYQLVQTINQIIAESSASANMLEEIAQVLGVALKVDCCGLFPVKDEVPVRSSMTAHWCAQECLEPLQPEEYSEQLDLAVVQCASEPLTIEDISTIEKSLVICHQYLPLPIKAVLTITTRFGGKSNGIIILIKSQPYNWSESERKQLKAVESSCAIAFSQVAQSQLIASQQQNLRACRQHENLVKQLTMLSRNNWELNQMLQLAIAFTAEALQVDRGLLILLKYTDPLFKNRAKKQIPKARATVVGEWSRKTKNTLLLNQQTMNSSFWISECGICQRVFTDSEKPVIINDNDDCLTAAPVLGLEQLPAVMLMPLESQGKILGFLVLQQAVTRSWETAELSIVEMVCAQLSNAIIQTQTLQQVQTLVKERTEQLQRSLEVQSRLYEIKRQQTEQLQRLNELKDEFLSNISDRLRYPLTNMRMALRMLRQPKIASEKKDKYLDILEDECTKEINLINDLLTLQKLKNHPEPPQLETIDLNKRIQDLAISFTPKLVDRGLNISLNLPEESFTLHTEVQSFDRILQELLTNACKYSEPNTIVQFHVTHEVGEQTNQVIIKVTNIGRGISEEEATYIFDMFRRGKEQVGERRWTPGTGLGLALVKSLVEHLNGTISVESFPLENSNLSTICFTLTLPQFANDTQP